MCLAPIPYLTCSWYPSGLSLELINSVLRHRNCLRCTCHRFVNLDMSTQAEIQELLNGPALAPPQGVKPSFVDPPNLDTLSYALLLVFVTIPTCILCIRLYTKARIVKKMALDDCTQNRFLIVRSALTDI